MSRLIDADELIRAIEEHYINLTNDNVPRSIPDFYSEMQKLVYNQPTAFDTERVVEQLEERKGNVFIDGKKMYQEDYFIDIDDAIDIVKKGGVE